MGRENSARSSGRQIDERTIQGSHDYPARQFRHAAVLDVLWSDYVQMGQAMTDPTKPLCAKFAKGQVVMYDRGAKRPFPVLILEVIEPREFQGSFFYRYDRRNALAESMLRPLTAEEAGKSHD